jgi:hypothetical protein
MTMVERTPIADAPQATACAWLPAEMEITPRAHSSGVNVDRVLRTPRGLNDPVF